MPKPRLVSSIMFAVALLVTQLGVSSAVAAPSTCSSSGRYFAGGDSDYQSYVFGSQAKIEYANPDLCGSDADGPGLSLAWAMVSAQSKTLPSNHDADMWAQSGWGQFGGGQGTFSPAGIGRFAQYTLKCRATKTCSGTEYKTRIDPSTPSTQSTYDAYRSSSTTHMRMRYDGTVLLDSTYDPYGDWASDWDVEYFGETGHPQDDVPGISSNHVNFFELKYYTSDNAFTYYRDSFTLRSSLSRYHTGTYTPLGGGHGQGIYIYTDPLS